MLMCDLFQDLLTASIMSYFEVWVCRVLSERIVERYEIIINCLILIVEDNRKTTTK